MSITQTQVLPCASCGVDVEVFVADSLNGGRHPHLRDAVLARRLHLFTCTACGSPFLVERELLYFDFARRQFVGVFPRGDRSREEACGASVMAAFEEAVKHGPEAVAEDARRWLVRLCFGYEELREKLVADDAKLNDLALEALKCDLLQAGPEFAAAGVLTLRLDGVEPSGRLRFLPEFLGAIPTGAEPTPVLVERTLYEATFARASELLSLRPGLARGPHVSLLRLIDWPAVDQARPKSII